MKSKFLFRDCTLCWRSVAWHSPIRLCPFEAWPPPSDSPRGQDWNGWQLCNQAHHDDLEHRSTIFFALSFHQFSWKCPNDKLDLAWGAWKVSPTRWMVLKGSWPPTSPGKSLEWVDGWGSGVGVDGQHLRRLEFVALATDVATKAALVT